MAADEARLLVRVEATQAKMEKQMAAIARSAAREAKASEDSFKTANDNIGRGFQRSQKQVVQSLGAQRAAVSNLSFQLNDIAMGLASGTSPFTIMVQQGSQVSQVLQGSGGLVGAVKTLGGAFTTMLNPVSLASFALIGITGLAVQYFSEWATGGKATTEEIEAQAKLIQQVADKWGDALPAIKAYADEVKRIADNADRISAGQSILGTLYQQPQQQVRNFTAPSVAATIQDLNATGTDPAAVKELQRAWDDLNDKLRKNTATAEDVRAVQAKVNDLLGTGIQSVAELSGQFAALAVQMAAIDPKAEEIRKDMRNMIVSFEDAGKMAQNLIGQMTGLGTDGVAAIKSLAGAVTSYLSPSISTAAEMLGEIVDKQAKYQAVGASAAGEMVKGFEGFIAKAKWDVNAFRVGFGSDTVTRADGTIEKVTKDTIVTLEDAQRDLSRRLIDFQSGIQKAIGVDTWKSLNEAQQAALTSIAYNYGSLPKTIVAAIEAGGGPAVVAKAIADLSSDNGGINKKRREQEAQSFLSGSGFSLADAGVSSSTKKTPDDIFAGNIAQVQKRIDILNAEFEAQSKLNPLIEDYGYAVEKAKIEAQLLADAQKAGLEVTPALAANISTLAENYAKASSASGALTAKNQELAQSMQAASAFGKDVMGGFISDLKAGKSASEALSNALSKVADKLLEVSLNALFDGSKAGSGGGFLGGIFGSIGKLLGFASGGYTGQGAKNQPAGVVHKGEYVFDKKATDRIGVRNLARLQKGYADGGYVGGMTPRISAPQIPASAGGGTAVQVTVGVSADNNGNLMPFVESVSERKAAQAARTGISQYDKQLDRSFGARMGRAQGRQL